MPSDTVNYRLLDRLIADVVTRKGYSKTLHDALHIVTRDGSVVAPEWPDPATDDVTED